MGQRESVNEDGRCFPMFELDSDPSVENYICQLADQAHYCNSRISPALMPFFAPDPLYNINADPAVDISTISSLNAERASLLKFRSPVMKKMEIYEDTIKLAKMAEGLIDIFRFCASAANLNHPTPYYSKKNIYAVLDDCAAVKAGGTKSLCAPI